MTKTTGKRPLSCRISAHLVQFVQDHGEGNKTNGLEDLLREAYARHTDLRAKPEANDGFA